MTQGPEVRLRLSNLRKSFAGHLGLRKKTIIDDLSLEVHGGEILGFLGANGAGKTTTIKMIVGLLFPDSGSIEIMGAPSASPGARQWIGFLAENPYFYDYLTAVELLTYYGRLYGMEKEVLGGAVERSLRRVGLQAAGGVQLRKYSKGMIQRVGLAQALINDPSLVVLDEPMSGLDPIGRRDVRDLMLELRDGGMTVFFSSHILQDAEMICDRVAIIAGGRLQSVGPLHELLGQEAESFEVLVRGSAAALAGLPSDGRRSAEGDRVLFRVHSPGARDELLQQALARGAQVEQVSPLRQTLEDLFLRHSAAGAATPRAR